MKSIRRVESCPAINKYRFYPLNQWKMRSLKSLTNLGKALILYGLQMNIDNSPIIEVENEEGIKDKYYF